MRDKRPNKKNVKTGEFIDDYLREKMRKK